MIKIIIYKYFTVLAVKNHQIAQFDLICKELEKEKLVCSQLREEVKRMEQEVSQRAVNKSSFPYVSSKDFCTFPKF